MTEREFEQRIENAADRLEQRIERSAERMDKTITARWNGNRLFRYTLKAISFTAELALLIGGWRLAENGHKYLALLCIVPGLLGLTADLITFLVFRRRRT